VVVEVVKELILPYLELKEVQEVEVVHLVEVHQVTHHLVEEEMSLL
tara:strand:+ start:184 stop:321 length:138 start_codon:yes stop_codon:yes gene_type:complete